MKNNWTIQDYQLVVQESRLSRFPIIFILLFVIGILIVCYKFNFQIYEKYNLIKDNRGYLLIVDSLKIPELEKNSVIYIQNKRYKYTITEVDSDYSNINGNIYQTIHIDPYNYKTEAILSECFLLKENKTIFQMIIEFIQGGIG